MDSGLISRLGAFMVMTQNERWWKMSDVRSLMYGSRDTLVEKIY